MFQYSSLVIWWLFNNIDLGYNAGSFSSAQVDLTMDNTEKVIRRSYSIPQEEQERLDALPSKFPKITPRLNKSEIIRLGVKLFDQLGTSEVSTMLNEKLDRKKVGKPKKLEIMGEADDSGVEITINERQWKQIAKLVPVQESRPGKPKQDDRQVLNGILYIFRFDKQRRDVPSNYSSFSTCRRRLAEWRKDSLWQKICSALVKNASNLKEKNQLSEVLLRTWIIDIK
jgi:transposase